MSITARSLMLLAAFGLLSATALHAAEFEVDGQQSKVTFIGTKDDGSHTGGFQELTGQMSVEGTDPTTLAVQVVINVDSMYTDDDKLTAHLKSPDFFEVKRYPQAKFVSTAVAQTPTGYNLTGNLTMHGVARRLTVPAQITVTPEGVQLATKFKVNRHDWQISYGKGVVHDAVALDIQLVAGQ